VAKISKKANSAANIDQRKKGDRRDQDRRAANQAVVVERRSGERRVKVARRRQIDPTTCERDYSPEEVEFMHALEQYKRANGRMFPTCSEVLEVLRGLGYAKQTRVIQVVVEGQTAIETCRIDAAAEAINPTTLDG